MPVVRSADGCHPPWYIRIGGACRLVRANPPPYSMNHHIDCTATCGHEETLSLPSCHPPSAHRREMSRRKQQNPRQIKRSLGEMEETEESLALEANTSDKDGSVSDLEDLADCDSSSPSNSDTAEAEGEVSSSAPPASDQEMCKAEPMENFLEQAMPPCDSEVENTEMEESANYKESEAGAGAEDAAEPFLWNGPDELLWKSPSPGGISQVCAQTELPKGLTWGPYRGTFTGSSSSPDRSDVGGALTLEVDEDCWLKNVTLVPCEFEANSVLYRKGDQIWCKTSQVIEQGEVIRAFLMAEPQAIPNFSIKEEPGEPSQEVTTQPEFQLLPQQAGMAAILATAVVNKDIFPCKDCGIWYRSERNLQAHLMYYCASRQSSTSPTVEDKPKDSYPNERVCPFPQCKKSCPSASSLEIHMRSHSGERPFLCLICLSAFTTKANCERHLKVHTDTLNGVCHGCGFISTTRDILYSHLVTNHMICQPGSKVDVYPLVKTLPAVKPPSSGVSPISSLLKCSLCGFLADSLASLQQHAIMHAAASLPGVSQPSSNSPTNAEKELPPDSLQNGDAKSPVSSSSSGMEDPPLKVHIKEEPEELRPVSEAISGSSETKMDESALVPSPAVKIKTEISSPTPGSSPVPNESGAAAGGGTIIVPQYMFGHEAAPAIVPQASEILAKMSELVHSRLKQGQAVAAVGFSGTPAPKGATCYECEITFNNINNYYVHKRLYCSGRHVSDDSAGSGRKVKVHPARAAVTPAMPAAEEQRVSPKQEDVSGEGSTLTVKIKVEEGTGPENEASGSGHASEGSQSPGPMEEAEEDPTRTVCEACNIHFSRHDTYVVHKRYYCASRHDPPLRRSSVINKPGTPFAPQSAPRTRKRRKLFEIHGVSPADLTPPALLPMTRVEALPLIPGLIATPNVPSPSSSPDAADGPIDLSKKPRIKVESPLPPSATPAAAAAVVPLTDYHECTACQISFNSLETYLAHKKFSCPVAPLQQKALQQLQKIKTPLNTSGKIGEEGVRVKVERRGTLSPASVSDSIQPVSLTYASVPDIKPLQQYNSSSAEASPSSAAACPYCPSNVVIRGDLLEHFRSVHGLLLTKPTPVHRLQTAFMEVLLPTRVQASSSSENSLPSPPASSTSPLQGQGLPRDVTNSKDAITSSSTNGSPVLSTTPRPMLTSTPRPLLPSSPALPLNPLAETRLAAHALLPGDKPMQAPKATLSSPLPNGNHRYCRLCNIKFSSLSTFIAHKKYYCSSHAAEHVK